MEGINQTICFCALGCHNFYPDCPFSNTDVMEIARRINIKWFDTSAPDMANGKSLEVTASAAQELKKPNLSKTSQHLMCFFTAFHSSNQDNQFRSILLRSLWTLNKKKVLKYYFKYNENFQFLVENYHIFLSAFATFFCMNIVRVKDSFLVENIRAAKKDQPMYV